MGNDGGSIPKRRELVKNASRAPTVSELKATALESLSHAWAHCALSGEPLDLNAAVSDGRGRLYNYEAILNSLMPTDAPAETTPASMGITSLRDVVRLKFSRSGDAWACPISMKKLGPATKVVYLVPCGHVFAEVALTEIQEKSCPECETAFDAENVIVVLPTTEKDMQRMANRLDGLRAKGLTHALKKDKSEKKKKKRKNDDSNAAGSEANADEIALGDGNKRSRQGGDSRVSGINNPLAASLTAKVLAEQDERNKRRRLAAGAGPRAHETAKG
ncbi:rtf2 RING-finger domain-containing protein [Hirsutella rhossiliensis]|uniref:Rtf2 RING-finger domain-containing protein n=1 Tax=Hirsutella rhossiliensis TaxID=111463 RepID=A0A9P8MUU7_9HYPO|nr:rtf2 RING-finger domain-containing protein [Hirsutella rhossiliensis]KAH0961462.1 rtf2 RING-finger domain-containing protein [Hirsutella rhossiliensis]